MIHPLPVATAIGGLTLYFLIGDRQMHAAKALFIIPIAFIVGLAELYLVSVLCGMLCD
jgi:hypothetical protein